MKEQDNKRIDFEKQNEWHGMSASSTTMRFQVSKNVTMSEQMHESDYKWI